MFLRHCILDDVSTLSRKTQHFVFSGKTFFFFFFCKFDYTGVTLPFDKNITPAFYRSLEVVRTFGEKM